MLNGAERLRTSQAEMGRPGRAAGQDFHIELLRLRQNWRLKKVGNTILGDLSYRSAGSMYRHVSVRVTLLLTFYHCYLTFELFVSKFDN